MKTKIIPFDLETAKKIQAGEIKGRIVTRDGFSVRSICYDAENEYPLVCLVKGELYEAVHSYYLDGRYGPCISYLDLFIELPEETLEPQFKPFDKVLVRKRDECKWDCDFFSHYSEVHDYVCVGGIWSQCITYDGHENLVGTTDKPKEE